MDRNTIAHEFAESTIAAMLNKEFEMLLFLKRSCVLFFVLAFVTVNAEIFSGRVVSIADGDTLTLLDSANQQHRIRLSGIDAPEKSQDFGQKSKANLSAMAFNRTASADCRKRDRYGREVCVVTVDGKDVGLELIRKGMAWWYRQYAMEQSPQERTDYEQAELIAKARSHGLWDGKDQVPPWEWRRNRFER